MFDDYVRKSLRMDSDVRQHPYVFVNDGCFDRAWVREYRGDRDVYDIVPAKKRWNFRWAGGVCRRLYLPEFFQRHCSVTTTQGPLLWTISGREVGVSSGGEVVTYYDVVWRRSADHVVLRICLKQCLFLILRASSRRGPRTRSRRQRER